MKRMTSSNLSSERKTLVRQQAYDTENQVLLTDPRTHQDGSTRQRILIIPQIHHKCKTQSSTSRIARQHDIPRRHAQILGESEISTHGVVQGTRETRVGRESVVDCEYACIELFRK